MKKILLCAVCALLSVTAAAAVAGERPDDVKAQVSNRKTLPKDVFIGTWTKAIEAADKGKYEHEPAKWPSGNDGRAVFTADGFTIELWPVGAPEKKLTVTGTYAWSNWAEGKKPVFLQATGRITDIKKEAGAPDAPKGAKAGGDIMFLFTWFSDKGDIKGEFCLLWNFSGHFFRKQSK